MTQIKPNAEVEKINSGLQAFDKKKSELEALVKEGRNLKIKDYDDKEGYLVVSEHRKKIKAARIEIEKQAKDMRALISPITKMISTKEAELVALIEPLEKVLKADEDKYIAEKDRIKQEAAEKENKRIQDRLDMLFQYGVAGDYITVAGMSDEQFTEFLNQSKADYEIEEQKKEAKRLAEEQAKKDEEKRLEKIAEDNRIEQQRLLKEKQKQDAEREKFEKEKRDFEEAQAKEKQKIEDDKKRILEEEANARVTKLNNRTDQLFNLGLRYDGEQYKGFGVFISHLDMQTYDDEKWVALILETRKRVDEGKQKEAEEQKEKEKELAKQAEEKAKKDHEDKLKKEEEEKKRQEGLKSDKEKLNDLANRLVSACTFKEIKDKKALEVAKDAMNSIERLAFDIKAKAEKL